MRRAVGAAAFFMTVGIGSVASTADQAALQPGAYEVEVRLELPHIDDTNTRKVETVCIASAKNQGTHGLAVLSSNNPLGKCPSTNVAQDGATLKFDIVCPGVNQARGRATYLVAPTRFQGRIEMKMGGKNMTMTEVQSGHRTGACGTTAAAPHS